MARNIGDLTARERQVLELIAAGGSNRQIAEGLRISVKTVSSHRERIMQKLCVHKATELTRAAIRMGVIEP